MPKIRIDKKQIRIGAKKIPLLSGEVHYWRLNPSCWPEILDRVRELGLDMISTYVPWAHHQIRPGLYDFTGRTSSERNLKAFLELARKKSLWVLIRPGPYIYSEWPNDGVPDDAFRYHRLHPEFLRRARRYMAAVMKVLKPFFADRPRGNILLLQADNEIDAWPDRFGDQYGLSGKPGLFQDYLRSVYANDLSFLNHSWGTAYDNFDEVKPFIPTVLSGETGLALKGDRELRRSLDYYQFKHFYAREYAKTITGMWRELGVTVPLYTNVYPFFYAQDWCEMQAASDLTGIDLYPTRELGEDAFEARKVADKVRYLSRISPLPFIAEFESGVWHGQHEVIGNPTPNHYRLLALTAMMSGAVGWNWYMLVNRDNWYQAPINEWGRTREDLYRAFRECVTLFKQLHPPSLKKICETAVTYNPLQYAARSLLRSESLEALHEAGIDYEIWDPRLDPPREKIVFYSGNQWLELSSQRALREFVEAGGTLVAFRDFPRKDDHFRPVSAVGFEEPHTALFEFKHRFDFRLATGRKAIPVISSVYGFNPKGPGRIFSDFGAYGKIAIGYEKKIGKGKLLHLGLKPDAAMLREIMDHYGIVIPSISRTPGVKTALFERGGRHFLIAVNLGREFQSALIELPRLAGRRGRYRARDLETGAALRTIEGESPAIVGEIPPKDGRAIEIIRH
ncbi:Glycosyl hydrolases family 35 protein [sediment metagenome]|uniref:Glycosyl hydrolases family 35 protein n=1 Tax=sediment metagenome TaxID=749907 RepID=D9PFU4_9ZZZZ